MTCKLLYLCRYIIICTDLTPNLGPELLYKQPKAEIPTPNVQNVGDFLGLELLLYQPLKCSHRLASYLLLLPIIMQEISVKCGISSENGYTTILQNSGVGIPAKVKP